MAVPVFRATPEELQQAILGVQSYCGSRRKMRIRYGLHLAAVIAACTLASFTLNAPAGLPAVAAHARAAKVNIRNETLVSTTFRTNVGPVTVACSSSLCENLGVFVTTSLLHVICP
jgi:hypothetical protein